MVRSALWKMFVYELPIYSCQSSRSEYVVSRERYGKIWKERNEGEPGNRLAPATQKTISKSDLPPGLHGLHDLHTSRWRGLHWGPRSTHAKTDQLPTMIGQVGLSGKKMFKLNCQGSKCIQHTARHPLDIHYEYPRFSETIGCLDSWLKCKSISDAVARCRDFA